MTDNMMNIAEKLRTELQDRAKWYVEFQGNHIFLKHKEIVVARVLHKNKMDHTGYNIIGMKILVDIWNWPLSSKKSPRASSFKPDSITSIVKRAMMIVRAYGEINDA